MSDPASEMRIATDAEDLAQTQVLIVVPALNEAGTIESVVTRLLDDAGDLKVELVVADGGSVDGTQEIVGRLAARDPRLRLLINRDRIQSAGINLAVSRFGRDADYLIRADAHALYPVGFCRMLVEDARRVVAASVTVPMIAEARGYGFEEGVAASQNSFLGTGGSAHRNGKGGHFVDHGHHALFVMSAFRAAGGYDPEFSHNEDAELDRRLTSAGYRIWLSDRAAIVYFPRSSAVRLFRQYLDYGRGRAKMLIRHRLVPRLRQVLPALIPIAVVLALIGGALAAATGSGAWSSMFIPVVLWVVICNAYGVVLAFRQGSGRAAWAGPAAMVMHLAWGIGFLSELWQNLEWHIPISKHQR